VLAEGNTTGANDIEFQSGQKIFSQYNFKGNDYEVNIEMGPSFQLNTTNLDATTNQGETGEVQILAGYVSLSVNAKDGLQSGTFQLNTDINGEAGIQIVGIKTFVISEPLGVKFKVELPTGTASLANGEWWNDNGTVKIYSV
jgi:hypothetical protein